MIDGLIHCNMLYIYSLLRDFCRAAPIQSPPVSCSFRALLEEEENHLIRVGQVGLQRGRISQGSPATPAPSARKVTFKCEEGSEPERPTGCVSSFMLAVVVFPLSGPKKENITLIVSNVLFSG